MPGSSDGVRLLLVGAGHAHLEILRRLARERPAWARPTLISPGTRHYYSGMVPGYLAGSYGEEEISCDLPVLCARADAEFHPARAVALDAAARRVRLEGGAEVAYDLVSWNVGSQILGADEEQVRRHAALLKPFHGVLELRRRWQELMRSRSSAPRRLVVVGGGAAGVEVACAAAAVADAAGAKREVTLLEAAPEILAGYGPRFVRVARRVLARKQIGVRTQARARRLGEDWIELAEGSRLPCQLAVWLTGAAAPELFRGSGLPVDERGFLLVDGALRSLGDRRIFAVGDCATLAAHPATPKAGVYAVREGPVLWRSLRATVEGGPLPSYVPQPSFLSLLNTADGKALLRYRGIVSWSRWAFRLKHSIDRRFLRRYQA